MNNRPDCLAVGLSPAIQKTLIFKKFDEGEVNRSEIYHMVAAGKCVNVARVLTQSGVNAGCLTIAGRENRSLFKSLCKEDSIDITAVETKGRVRTCTTIVDTGNDNTCTELVVNEPEVISREEEEAFRKVFHQRISDGYKCLIISGSKFPGFSDEIIPHMVEVARGKGIFVVADYKGNDLKNSFASSSIRPDYVKINESEFYETFGQSATLEEGLLEVSSRYGCAFVISRGSRSTIAVEKGQIIEVESKLIKALNPIGCGDSMTAGLARGILEGRSLKEAVEKGRDYAARNAMSIHPGWILESE